MNIHTSPTICNAQIESAVVPGRTPGARLEHQQEGGTRREEPTPVVPAKPSWNSNMTGHTLDIRITVVEFCCSKIRVFFVISVISC